MLLMKESVRDPSSLLWAVLAPFLLLLMSPLPERPTTHLHQVGWFYAYISANVAFFGFSYYLIGRRESGFIRSFIYRRGPMLHFLAAHTMSYTLVSLLYASVFYLATKPLHGAYSIEEYTFIIACFFTSYLGFTLIGLAIASLPLTFNTAGTLFSLISFLMLTSSFIGAATVDARHPVAACINPLFMSAKLFRGDISIAMAFPIVLILSVAAFCCTARYFRIQPVWSRY